MLYEHRSIFPADQDLVRSKFLIFVEISSPYLVIFGRFFPLLCATSPFPGDFVLLVFDLVDFGSFDGQKNVT